MNKLTHLKAELSHGAWRAVGGPHWPPHSGLSGQPGRLLRLQDHLPVHPRIQNLHRRLLLCEPPGPGERRGADGLPAQRRPREPDPHHGVPGHPQAAQRISHRHLLLLRPLAKLQNTGYREPPRVPEKILFFSFIGILGALSVLGTALLLWKKKQMRATWKQLAPKIPAPKIPAPSTAPSTASPEQPPDESLYTALQRQDTEVYACMQSEAGSPPPRRSFLSQENAHRFQDESEFNLVYENL